MRSPVPPWFFCQSPDENPKGWCRCLFYCHFTRWIGNCIPSTQEFKATSVLSFPIEEGSAKLRTGAPSDDAEDYALPIWAGELPLKVTPGIPIADPKLASDIPIPKNIVNYHRGNSLPI